MQKTAKKIDKFEMHLQEMLVKLQECQKEKTLKSCSDCECFLTCALRTDYIKAVYNSMSKGDTGGFEF
ncbi:hypothetical protein JHD48_08830 [Sulfurimonas sp. SAG-AH-194-I05]|nr:hypothetical protein [Sulfurimonas sp. SAG-AH-194-I05]MDF1875837.1 hypothetical protein [Sulfurimonas sp. SAG-AH-194-I05]